MLFPSTRFHGADASITAGEHSHLRPWRNLGCVITGVPRTQLQWIPTTLVWSTVSTIPWRLLRPAQVALPRRPPPLEIQTLQVSTGMDGPAAVLPPRHWPATRRREKNTRLILIVTYIKIAAAIIPCILECHYHDKTTILSANRTKPGYQQLNTPCIKLIINQFTLLW